MRWQMWSGGVDAKKQIATPQINDQTWSRMWAGLQCAVNTLHIDAPWRMFSQVITLCARPRSQHSVIYPSYESADRNPVSRMCLWFNQLRQADDLVFMTATKSRWNITRELRERDDRRCRPQPDFSATASTHRRRLNMCTFIFSSLTTTALTNCGFT